MLCKLTKLSIGAMRCFISGEKFTSRAEAFLLSRQTKMQFQFVFPMMDLYSAANDRRSQMIPRPEMISK